MVYSSRIEPSTGRWSIPIALFCGSLLLVAATLKDYGITWDEPAYFYASELHVQWFSNLAHNIARGEPEESLSGEAIKAAWHWDPYHVPHPPFSRIMSGLTATIASPWTDKFSAYRLAPALFFAVLTVVIYLWISEIFGNLTGVFSALGLVLIPNLFGFAHFAVTDLPLACMWFLTSYSFWKGLKSWKWSAALGIIWGLALATKFPALLIPIPLFLWAHLCYRQSYTNNVFAMVFLAPLIMIISQPYLWHQPLMGILEFLYQGVSRGYRADANFPIFFYNKLYTTDTLPWYYSLFMVAVTTPEVILALALVGTATILWPSSQRTTLVLFLTNGLFLLFLGLAPGAVLHDGMRQLLSVLPFIAALAGAGFSFLVGWSLQVASRSEALQRIQNLRGKTVAIAFVLLLFSPALDLYLCHPFQLSFYNRLVGGIRGAYERGLEMTYFMDAFTPDFIRSISKKLPPNSTLNASFANFMFSYYQEEGRLRRDIKIVDGRPFDYYILLNRRSVLSPRQRFFVNGPFATYLSVKVAGVPLVAVFAIKNPR